MKFTEAMERPHQKNMRRQNSVKDPDVQQEIIWKMLFNMHQVFCRHVNDDRLHISIC